MFWSTVILMPFVEQIVEYSKTSDKRGVTVDFLAVRLACSFLISPNIVKNVTRRVVLYVYSEGSESYTAILRVLTPSYTYRFHVAIALECLTINHHSNKQDDVQKLL
jgi:hypothetical protein